MKSDVGAKDISIRRAREVKRKAPKLHEAVKVGKIKVSAAAAAVRAPQKVRDEVIERVEAGKHVDTGTVHFLAQEAQLPKDKPDIDKAFSIEIKQIDKLTRARRTNAATAQVTSAMT